jgi:hypothetical protein
MTVQDWQPIETAPTNTLVLCYWQQFNLCDVVRLDPTHGWTDDDEAEYTAPSHWMPLVKPLPVDPSPST